MECEHRKSIYYLFSGYKSFHLLPLSRYTRKPINKNGGFCMTWLKFSLPSPFFASFKSPFPISLPQQGHHLTLKLSVRCGTQMSAPSLRFQSCGFFLLTDHLETPSIRKFLPFWQSLKGCVSLTPRSSAGVQLWVSSSFFLFPTRLKIHRIWYQHSQVSRHRR